MRVNIYAEEMSEDVEVIAKVIDGQTFTGLRLYLYLPVTEQKLQPIGDGEWATGETVQHRGKFMHRPGDDDSAAVTFWGKRDLRKVLRVMLAALDKHYDEERP